MILSCHNDGIYHFYYVLILCNCITVECSSAVTEYTVKILRSLWGKYCSSHMTGVNSMKKQRVLLTGATGSMGFPSFLELLKDTDDLDLVVLAINSKKNRKLLTNYTRVHGLEIFWGNLTKYADMKKCVKDVDIILHVAAFVSPAADYHPKRAMKVNYGSVVNIVRAIRELKQEQQTKLVYIGTVAQTGDRMPPIHWGRIGDPIKPSVYDYYAVSKVAAERYIAESGLPYWVSLRQTGIMCPSMGDIRDPIIFHNCLDNVLEYVSDRDSARLLRRLCARERNGKLGNEFWGHFFNIGGGKDCRASAYAMYESTLGAFGVKRLSDIMDSQWFATRNFHGQYYLDSDKLNDILDFRQDTMEYGQKAYTKNLTGASLLAKGVASTPVGHKMLSFFMKKYFKRLARARHGTIHFIESNMEEHIAAYWGSREAWEAIPPFEEFQHFADWNTVVPIDHGYDESKPEDLLDLSDLQGAAEFRGGVCLSSKMTTGDWVSKLKYRCGFGHEFEASPRLILEGGHWCPVCESKSWNYYERAKIDPFFAQVWYPLHDKSEKEWSYTKIVSELDARV